MATLYTKDKRDSLNLVEDGSLRLLQPDGTVITVNWLREVLDAITSGGGGTAQDREWSETLVFNQHTGKYMIRVREGVDGTGTVKYYDLNGDLLANQPPAADVAPIAVRPETPFRMIERVQPDANYAIKEPLNWHAILQSTVDKFWINGVDVNLEGLQATYGEGNLPSGLPHRDIELRSAHGEFIVVWESFIQPPPP